MAKTRRKLPRCPLCGATMHVIKEGGLKFYKCSNFETTGCSARIIHPEEKKRRY